SQKRTGLHQSGKESCPKKRKKERQTKAAPQTPTKGRYRTALGRRSLSGARSKHCLCSSRAFRLRLVVFEKAELDARASFRMFSWLAFRTATHSLVQISVVESQGNVVGSAPCRNVDGFSPSVQVENTTPGTRGQWKSMPRSAFALLGAGG